jgi:hypothetical protein
VQTASPTFVVPNVLVSLPEGQTFDSATVRIANWQPEDRLAFTNTVALQNSFTQDATTKTATLTITGPATAADVTTFLRSVTYQDVAGSPNTSVTRVATIGFKSGSNRLSGKQTIDVVTVLAGLGGTATYVAGATPVAIAPNVNVNTPDNQLITSATVSFVDWQPEDRVAFTNRFALQHSFVQNTTAQTATLTITGSETAAHYQTLLQSVTYQDVTTSPQTSITRAATFTVKYGSTQSSGTQDIVVLNSARPVVDVNDATALAYTGGTAAIAILSKALITDSDSANLTKLTVQITSGYQSATADTDFLLFTALPGITGSFNTTTGILTLSGTSSVANYRTVLRTVKFQSTGTAVVKGARTFTIIATDSGPHVPSTSLPVTQTVTVQ